MGDLRRGAAGIAVEGNEGFAAAVVAGAAYSPSSPLATAPFLVAGGKGCHKPASAASLSPAMRPGHYDGVCNVYITLYAAVQARFVRVTVSIQNRRPNRYRR